MAACVQQRVLLSPCRSRHGPRAGAYAIVQRHAHSAGNTEGGDFRANSTVMLKSAGRLKYRPSAKALLPARPLHQAQLGRDLGAAGLLNPAPASECWPDDRSLGKRGWLEKPRSKGPRAKKNHPQLCGLGPARSPARDQTSPAPAGSGRSAVEVRHLDRRTMNGSGLPRLLPLRLCPAEKSPENHHGDDPTGWSSHKQGCHQEGISRQPPQP